jgi:hypothetical protein
MPWQRRARLAREAAGAAQDAADALELLVEYARAREVERRAGRANSAALARCSPSGQEITAEDYKLQGAN